MNKGRPKIRLFTSKQVHEADTMERIYMHLVDPSNVHLTERDEAHYAAIARVHEFYMEEKRQSYVVKFIISNIPEFDTPYKAAKLYEAAVWLFGMLHINDKPLLKQAIHEKLLLIAQELEKNKQYIEAANLLLKIAELNGLNGDEIFNPDDIQLPSIIITPDISALRIGQDE